MRLQFRLGALGRPPFGQRLEDRPDVRPAAQVAVGAIFGASTLPQRERLGVTFGRDRGLELALGVPVLGAQGGQLAPVFVGHLRDLRDLRQPRADLAGPHRSISAHSSWHAV